MAEADQGGGIVWYGMVRYGMVWYGMVWYGMVWYGMVGITFRTGQNAPIQVGNWEACPVEGGDLRLKVAPRVLHQPQRHW